jgi:hypothetical protein
MMNNSFDRRKVLSLLGGVGATVLAGCGGSDDVSVPNPEEENQEQEPQQEQTQEEQDELQEPPYEDRLEPQYAEQHEEAMQEVNQYTVDIVSKEGFVGPFFDGTIRVNEDVEEVLAEFDIAPEGVDFDKPNVNLQVYRNGGEILARTDDGELQYSKGEPDVTDGKVTDFDTTSQLLLPNQMMRPGDSVRELLDNVPVYLDSDRNSPEHNNVDGEAFVYNVDVVDLVQGEFGEWLKDKSRDNFDAELSLDKKDGYVSSFAISFDRERQEDTEWMFGYKYKATMSEGGNYTDLEPDWAPVARDI